MPDVLLQSHSAPLGMVFYTGTQFPAEYQGDAFVALHGSWNRKPRTGYNVRFNEINAAIGRVMLRHLDGFNLRRREIAARYNEGLKGVVRATPPERSWANAVYHMYVIRCERRDELQKFLKEQGIETGIRGDRSDGE